MKKEYQKPVVACTDVKKGKTYILFKFFTPFLRMTARGVSTYFGKFALAKHP